MLQIWRTPYSMDTLRRFGSALFAVPLAVLGIARSRRARSLLSLPVAALSTFLTVALGWLVLINVLAYPFRAYLGVPNETRDIWSDHYSDSWGGPTLAGAWATHAALALVVGVPAVAWAVRGLGMLQHRLTARAVPAVDLAAHPAAVAVSGGPLAVSAIPVAITAGPIAVVGRRRPWRPGRVLAVVGTVAVSVALARLSHAVGIGDNVLWLPHKPVDALALAVTLAPLAAGAALMTRRRATTR